MLIKYMYWLKLLYRIDIQGDVKAKAVESNSCSWVCTLLQGPPGTWITEDNHHYKKKKQKKASFFCCFLAQLTWISITGKQKILSNLEMIGGFREFLLSCSLQVS